ncbi:hypothetical protein BJX70DRAFT_369052 [Aspergillus crustosus]
MHNEYPGAKNFDFVLTITLMLTTLLMIAISWRYVSKQGQGRIFAGEQASVLNSNDKMGSFLIPQPRRPR